MSLRARLTRLLHYSPKTLAYITGWDKLPELVVDLGRAVTHNDLKPPRYAHDQSVQRSWADWQSSSADVLLGVNGAANVVRGRRLTDDQNRRLHGHMQDCLHAIEAYNREAADAAFAALLLAMQECEVFDLGVEVLSLKWHQA